MSRFKLLFVAAIAGLLSCSTGTQTTRDVAAETTVAETVSEIETDSFPADLVNDNSLPMDLPLPDEWVSDDDALSGCEAGEGCFLAPCQDNSECLSGWCVQHMGESVCTTQCTEECPAGWSCQLVAGSVPDAVFICISDFTHLCRPCAIAADCKSTVGTEDVCLDYGDEGSFCGGGCNVDEDCPWGFSCQLASTVDGVETRQCVADAGVCPCTSAAVELALWTPCEVANEWGSCIGKRVCGDAGLSSCDALVPGEETCNGLDDNCDGATDEGTCDDGNLCTADACAGEDGCQHTPLDEGECLDGNPCTVADHCEAGECVGAWVDCDDENPCTDDSCDATGGCLFEPNTLDCDDGDPCTVADACQAMECQGVPVDCACQETADCGALENGNLCDGTLVCDLSKLPYQCVVDPATVVTCPLPEEGPHAFCQAASCDPVTGTCTIVPAHEGFACADGDACTMGEKCVEGACGDGVTVNCNDGDVCTDDSCDSDEGCLHTFNEAPCDDGDACTVADVCAAGECAGPEAKNCDDGNVCTDDSCDPVAGCQHSANQDVCDDGNACTLGDICLAGQCKAGKQFLDCDDDDPCTDDLCDADNGCVYALNTAPCDDGDACTTGDLCDGGQCAGSGQLVCDDANVCTDDSCDAQEGCQFAPNQAECDDGNQCTTAGQCQMGGCVGTDPISCDDDNPCTTDTCDPAKGCLHTDNSAPCDDGDVCTLKDLCVDGECVGSVALDCNDLNPCTTDACDEDVGCLHEVHAGACDDNNACTDGDTCKNGLCLPGSATNCDDSNECTVDTCDEVQGCLYVNAADGAACDGGGKWACAAGECSCLPQCDGKSCGDDQCGGICGTCPEGEDCNQNSGQCYPGGGISYRGYVWFLGPRGNSCLGVCEAAGLSCANLVAATYIESCNDNICLQFFQGLPCGGDGDGPRLSATTAQGLPGGSSKCIYRSNNWGGWSCGWVERADDVRFCPCQ